MLLPLPLGVPPPPPLFLNEFSLEDVSPEFELHWTLGLITQCQVTLVTPTNSEFLSSL